MANTTWNPNDKNSITLSGSNLTATANATGDHGVRGTDIKYSGKYYFEVTIGTMTGADTGFGIASPGALLNTVTDNRPNNAIGSSAQLAACTFNSGSVFVNGSNPGSVAGLLAGSVYACAVNLDVSPAKIAFRKVTGGGNWNNNVANDPATGAFDISSIVNLGVFPVFSSGGNTAALTANFGDTGFSGSVPAGYTSGWPANTDAALYIDPVSLAGSRGEVVGGSSKAITMTTQGAGDVIIIVGTENNGTANTVSSVSGSTLGSFTLRKRHHTKPGATTDMVVEEWYKHSTGALSAESITVTLGGTNDRMSIVGFQVVNADSGIWDANAAVPATGQNSGSTSRSVAGISTTASKTLVLAYGVSPDSPDTFASGFASGYTGVGGFYGHSGGTNWCDLTLWGKYVTTTQSSVSAATGTITSEQWAAVADAVKEAVTAGPSGTWDSTEAADTFAGAGYPQLKGTWASAESKDTFAGTGKAHQVFDVTTSFTAATSADATSKNITVSTSNVDDLIVLFISAKRASAVTVSSITDTSGLTWNKRTAFSPASNTHEEMEIWWARATSIVTNDVITVNVSASAGIAIVAAIIADANWSSPFDGHNADSIEVDNAGSGNPSATITTDNFNPDGTLIFGFLASDDGGGGITQGGGAVNTGMDTFLARAVTTGGTTQACEVGYKRVTTNETGFALSFTQNGGSSNDRYLMADAIISAGVKGTWTDTEAKDIWASYGSLIGGSWHSTDLRDLFSAAGYPQMIGSWGSTEAKDVWAGTGAVPPFGPLAAIEAKDTMGFTGEVGRPLGIDAHATAHTHDDTSCSVALTTTAPNDVIVLAIYTGGFWNRAKVATITDTAGLVWKKRNQRWNTGSNPSMEIWWAKKTTIGATTITVHTGSVAGDPVGATQSGATTGFLCIDALAISGANADKPWDTHTGAGWYTDSFGNMRFGTPGDTGTVARYYSNATKGLALAFYNTIDLASTGVPSAGIGWTWLERVSASENAGQTGVLESAYKVFSGAHLFNDFFQLTEPPPNGVGAHAIMQDVIVSANDPAVLTNSTDDLIRWHFDGHGNQTVLAMSGTNKTATQTFTTFESNTVAVVCVLVQGSRGAQVDHVSDDGGHSGWTRRSIVTDGVSMTLEVWWCQFPAPFAGNITVTLDSNTQPGDILGFIVNGINGPDVFQRGEIWDGDSSLPAATFSGVVGYERVGPFSTLNENVLEINVIANTSQDQRGFNENPWMQFVGDFFGSESGLLVSHSPLFNIALDFKFSGAVVNHETVEVNVSPKPAPWFSIADALPVGPVSPPQGVWGSTEAKDITTHTGDFTSIGVASPQGWVGFLPIQAVLDATEAKDRATNTGAFTAIWDTNGWIGYVPAFMTLAVTDHKDTWASHGWVLGPTTILARWESTEPKDSFGAASVFTLYTTPDSRGDRTSRITVLTNALLGGSSGTPDKLVNGLKANNAASGIWVTPSQIAPMFFQFDFGIPKVVNEATWFQNGTSAQPGLWKWQGSNDASSWTDLSATFVLNAGNTGAVIGDFSSNQTAYRYYRILQTTLAGGNDTPWLWEIDFKVAGFSAAMGVAETKDRMNYQLQLIPKAAPIPARKRRLLIVT